MASVKLIVLFITTTVLVHQAEMADFNYQTCDTLWTAIGCKIDYHRNLTILQDDRQPNAAVKINWDNLKGYERDLMCRCRKKAKDAGNEWFAIEKTGICLTHKGELANYIKSFPLDDKSKCGGILSVHAVKAPDGSSCTVGVYRAYFYQIKLVNQETRTTPPPEVTAQPPEPSCSLTSDLALVIDSSGSVTEDGFKLVKTFLYKFLDRFDFGKGKSRVAIVTYDQECYLNLDWIQSSKLSLSQLRDVITNLRYSGGSTRTDLALECTRKMIIQQQRAHIPKTVCAMTDGKSWNGTHLVPKPAGELRKIPKLKMVAIGIGAEVDEAELIRIAGKKENIIQLENFKKLIENAVETLNKIIKKVCIV